MLRAGSIISLAACVFVTLASGASLSAGERPAIDFDLRADCPMVVGSAERTISFEGRVVLTTNAASPQGDGAQAWSLSLRAIGGSIIDATTAGTVAAPAPAGLVVDGFVTTALTSGPGNEGVISAVILSFALPITLPAAGDALLLRLTVEAPVPERDCAKLSLLFADGLRGDGQSVENRITYRDRTYKDDGGLRDSDADRETPCFVTLCRVVPFVRGNCNGDEQLDLADPVSALNELFRGTVDGRCQKGCDVNDDGFLNLTDPVHTLQHLFRSGPPPAPPFPDCGLDPTADTLSCNRDVACET